MDTAPPLRVRLILPEKGLGTCPRRTSEAPAFPSAGASIVRVPNALDALDELLFAFLLGINRPFRKHPFALLEDHPEWCSSPGVATTSAITNAMKAPARQDV